MNKKLLTKIILVTALTTTIIPTINNSKIVYANGKVGTAVAQGEVYHANGYLKGSGGYINTGMNDINNSDFNYTTEKLDLFYKPCYSQSLVNEINTKKGKAFLATDPEGKNKVDVAIKAINCSIYGEQGTLIIANNDRKKIKRGTYYFFITDDNGYYRPFVGSYTPSTAFVVNGNDISPMIISTSYVSEDFYEGNYNDYTSPVIDLKNTNLVFENGFRPLAEDEIINNKDRTFNSRDVMPSNDLTISKECADSKLISDGSGKYTVSTFIKDGSSRITQIECKTIDSGLNFFHDGPNNYIITTTDRDLEFTEVAPGVTFTIIYE